VRPDANAQLTTVTGREQNEVTNEFSELQSHLTSSLQYFDAIFAFTSNFIAAMGNCRAWLQCTACVFPFLRQVRLQDHLQSYSEHALNRNFTVVLWCQPEGPHVGKHLKCQRMHLENSAAAPQHSL
jgi:hypothetical protein